MMTHVDRHGEATDFMFGAEAQAIFIAVFRAAAPPFVDMERFNRLMAGLILAIILAGLSALFQPAAAAIVV